MADKDLALPRVRPQEEDEVLEFESSAVENSNSELDDEFLDHIALDDEEDGKLTTPLRPRNTH